MKIRHFALASAFAGAAFTTAAHAQAAMQDTTKAPVKLLSPRDTARGTIGGAHLLVDYGRPSMRGRAIFGEKTLVPYDKVWRTGANAATTLVTDKDITIGGIPVPAGTYTLYSLPSAKGWQLIINKQTGQWGTEYDQTKDLARVPMKLTTIASPVEKFEIVVGSDSMLHLRWDTVDAAVPVAAAK